MDPKASVLFTTPLRPTNAQSIKDLNSFRPISNLSCVYQRPLSELWSQDSRRTPNHMHHLLPSRQSADRVNHSTETAIIAVKYVTSLCDRLPSNDVYTLVLLDLSSAFDAVAHDTLLPVLTHRFGVNGPPSTCSALNSP